MKTRLSLAVATAALLTALFGAVPSAKAATPSYTGCLSPILNVVYDVAPGDLPAHPPCLRPANMIHLSSGDLTSLTAGTGLTGGGDNGDLSLGIAPSYRLPQGCSSGQTAGWNGTAWACAAFTSQADFNSLVALLGTPGTINDGSNPVHWTKLKGVPPGSRTAWTTSGRATRPASASTWRARPSASILPRSSSGSPAAARPAPRSARSPRTAASRAGGTRATRPARDSPSAGAASASPTTVSRPPSCTTTRSEPGRSPTRPSPRASSPSTQPPRPSSIPGSAR